MKRQLLILAVVALSIAPATAQTVTKAPPAATKVVRADSVATAQPAGKEAVKVSDKAVKVSAEPIKADAAKVKADAAPIKADGVEAKAVEPKKIEPAAPAKSATKD